MAAIFSAKADWIREGWLRLEAVWGPIADLSEAFDFVESEYYHRTMGPGLKKQLAVFRSPYDPSELPADKLFTNDLERSWPDRSQPGCREPRAALAEPVFDPTLQRPINIDPGYMSLTKLVLASTKNREHRIYLREGIYAEVTLAYRDQAWQSMPWTYADYQRADVRGFLARARRRFSANIAARGEANASPASSTNDTNLDGHP
jgi:hypothetical protein